MAFPSSEDITVPSTDEELKAACRLGLHPALRRSLWRRLVSAEPRADFYGAACVRVFGSAQSKPSRLFRVPFLGNTPWAAPPDIVPLLSQPSVSTSSAHDRIVCVLAQLYGLMHCPMAANLALLLLAHASEAESFAVLEALLSPAAGERRLFQTPLDDAAFARAFMEVTRERHPQLIRHLESCGRDATLRMFESWFRTLFYGWLPFADVLCVVDAFLSEGPKVLIRLGMAWLRARKRALKRCRTIEQVEASLRGWVAGDTESDDAFAYSYPAMAEHGFALRRLGRDVIAGYMTQAARRTGGGPGAGLGGGGGSGVAGLIAGAVSGGIRRGVSASAADADDDDDDDGGMVLLSRGGGSGSGSGGGGTAAAAAAAGAGAAASPGALARANSSPAMDAAAADGAAATASAAAAAAAAAEVGRWYNPLVVGRPPVLLPLRPLPRELATEAEHVAARREALATVAGHKAAAALDAGGDPAAILASLPADAAAAVATSVARRLTLPPSVLAQPPSFSTASSPSLAALVALLPARSRSSDWRCLYTTTAHGWTRTELLRHTAGVAPLLLVMRMALPPGKARASSAPGAGSSPVFGVFLNDGLAMPSASSATPGASRWQGQPTDFLFQLQPHVTLFPAHPPSAAVARAHSVPAAGGHDHSHPASASSGAAPPGPRHGPRLRLSSDRMTLSTSDFTAFGGAHSSTAVALRLPDTFSRCTASAELLFELGLISARDLHDAAFGVEPEVELHGLEAFGLVDGSASVSFSRSATGRLGPASLARVEAAERKERAEAAELAEQQAHAFGGEAAVADLKARVSRLVGDERGAAEANRVAAEFEARQRDAATRASAFRE